MTLRFVRPHALSRDELRAAFLGDVDRLHRRQASQIGDDYIDDYVALNWLEWHGGALRLTTVGENVCRQLKGLH